ncbi:MAG: hypothetical protein KGZ88_11875 [Methylomicrobium sp.]|nr:hypothetical protein [Methylomicrobium sp.]
MIEVKLTGTEDVFKKFKQLNSELKTKVVKDLADAVFEDVDKSVGAHSKTGKLESSLKIRKIDDGYAIEHDLQIAPHAVFVHWGTKPHVIKPKYKKRLRWASGSGFIFAKFVNHPGYKGDPYMVEAANQAPKHLERIINSLDI